MILTQARGIGYIVLFCAAALFPTIVWSAPSTATFMNVMTVCGAGSTVNIDANLQGSIVGVYEKEATKGRAVQQIIPEIAKLLPQSGIYSQYLACVRDLLSHE